MTVTIICAVLRTVSSGPKRVAARVGFGGISAGLTPRLAYRADRDVDLHVPADRNIDAAPARRTIQSEVGPIDLERGFERRHLPPARGRVRKTDGHGDVFGNP